MYSSLNDLDFSDIVSAIQERDKEKFKKNALDIYSTGASMKFPTKPEEFVVGPKWWQEMTGLLGLPYGFFVQVAGKTDSGKCLSKDSTLLMTERGIETMGEALQGLPTNVDGKKVGYWHDDGLKKGLRVKFSDGSILEGTPNHKVKVLTKNLTLEWKRLDQLTSDDYIPNVKSTFPFNNHYDLKRAELIGYILADGHMNGTSVKLSDLKTEKYQVVKRLLQEVGVYSENKHYLYVNAENTRLLGLDHHTTSHYKEIPKEILHSNRPAIMAFLRGLLSADGSMEENSFTFCTSSHKMVQQVQFILKAIGIPCTVRDKRVKGYDHVYKEMVITGGVHSLRILDREIGISLPSKNERLQKYLQRKSCSKKYLPYVGQYLTDYVRRTKLVITREQRDKANFNFLRGGFNVTVDNYRKVKEAIVLPSEITDLIDGLCEMHYVNPTEITEWEGECADPNIPSDHTYYANNLITHNTSCVIEFCRHAQQQNVVVVFVDTERKTTKTRFTQWGVDPEKLIVVRPKTLEQMYRGIDLALDTVQEKYPQSKILLIVDSLGNTPSETEMEADIADPVQMGKRANINNRGFSRLVPRLEDNISVLIINQTYDNMGSPGKQNKGGTTKEFACAITFQTSRVGWIEGTVKGEKVRKGAKVKWNIYKHHLIDNQAGYQGKTFEIDITANGMALKGELPDKFKQLRDDEITIDEETGEILE